MTDLSYEARLDQAFEEAFDELARSEGEFGDDSRDAGNWTSGVVGKGKLNGTKYGISAASYPQLDIKNITLAEAKEIYRRDYWDVWVGLEGLSAEMPPSFIKELFDAGVNAGKGNAKRFLQRAINVLDDGLIGDVTIAALDRAFSDYGIARVEQWFLGENLDHYTELSIWTIYGRGWAKRIARRLKNI